MSKCGECAAPMVEVKIDTKVSENASEIRHLSVCIECGFSKKQLKRYAEGVRKMLTKTYVWDRR